MYPRCEVDIRKRDEGKLQQRRIALTYGQQLCYCMSVLLSALLCISSHSLHLYSWALTLSGRQNLWCSFQDAAHHAVLLMWCVMLAIKRERYC